MNNNTETFRNTDIINESAVTTVVNGSFFWMMIGLLVSALVAGLVTITPAISQVILGNTLVFYGLIIAQVALVWYVSARTMSMSITQGRAWFVAYAGLNGLTLSSIFAVFSLDSIITIFISSAAMFGLLAWYGYTTRKNLSGIGRIAFFGLIGIVIATIINIFVGSSILNMIVSWVGVIVFSALTAYDVQSIKETALSMRDESEIQKFQVLGALMLYLDFINLFLSLLQIFGSGDE